MSLKDAFNALLGIHKRTMTIKRLGASGAFGSTGIEIQATPSNYYRNLQGPAETVMPGNEFVISRKHLEAQTVPLPLKRGDLLIDTEMGTMSIVEIRDMLDFGGAIIGYRVRTG